MSLAIAIASALAAAAPSASFAEELTVDRAVTAAGGTVALVRGAQAIPLVEGQRIQDGDLVRVEGPGSLLVLVGRDSGRRVVLNGGAEPAELLPAPCWLKSGKAFFFVPKQTVELLCGLGRERKRNLGVKGTRFSVELWRDGGEVVVGDGAVDVEIPATHAREKIARGEKLAFSGEAMFVRGPAAEAQLAAIKDALEDSAARRLFAEINGELVEPRLSHPAADRFRRFDAIMSGNPHPDLAPPLELLARLEQEGDQHAIAAAYLFTGHAELATAHLDRAAPSPGTDVDRAAVALVQKRPRDALPLLESALERDPANRPALWNLGLALRDLGLEAKSAEAFERLAKMGEQGWAAEAAARAAYLREALTRRRAVWTAASAAGRKLVAEGTIPDPALLRSIPGISRLYFYDAARSAATPEELRQLAPVAEQLDLAFGGHVLADYLARLKKRGFARRAPLARIYRKFAVDNTSLSGKALDNFLTSARRAGEDDILMGALYLTRRAMAEPADYIKLALATRDPWFLSLADLVESMGARAKSDFVRAEGALTRGLERCTIEYRCADLEWRLADLYTTLHAPAAAWRHVAAGRARAIRIGEWKLEHLLLGSGAQTAILSREFAYAAAAMDEYTLREPEDCDAQRFARRTSASVDIFRGHPARAKARMLGAQACEGRLSNLAAWVLTDAYRQAGASAEEREQLRLELEHLRSTPGADPTDQVLSTFLLGRFLIESDRAAGRARILEAIQAARAFPREEADASRVIAQGYTSLIVDAERSGEHAAALEYFARARDLAKTSSCTLGLAVDDERRAIAVVDKSGGAYGFFDGRWNDFSGEPPPEKLIPQEMIAKLSGCTSVEVLAQPPLIGLPRLLPKAFAWYYRMGGAPPKSTLPPRRLIVTDVLPPAELGLPVLPPYEPAPAAIPATILRGAAATPARVLAELTTATEVEIHTHGWSDPSRSDAALLVLSPDADGNAVLAAEVLRRTRLAGSPRIFIEACGAAKTARYLHEPWSLPDAFIEAGARTVIAASAPIFDAGSRVFFEEVRAALERGVRPAIAVRDARLKHDSAEERWIEQVMVFER